MSYIDNAIERNKADKDRAKKRKEATLAEMKKAKPTKEKKDTKSK